MSHVPRFLSMVFIPLLFLAQEAAAESPAPTIHWGGLGYPDQLPTLSVGFTINRFTEFDNPTRNNVPYDSTIHESFGLNFLSFSWTRQWDCAICLHGLTTNLTAGIGPTAEQPSKFLQNSVIHKAFGIPPVKTATIREDTDAMVDGSLTKWFSMQQHDASGGAFGDSFVGAGFSVGTLYQEVFARAGVQRMAIPGTDNVPIRFSMMGRYSRLFDGALLHAVPPQSILWQPAVSFGPYPKSGASIPPWELELALTWDSGIFVNTVGQSHKERFWSFSYRWHGLKIETWNDSFIAHKDRGPTYGAELTFNILYKKAPD